MKFPFASTDAAAKCIGSYERELHPEVERIIAGGYRAIINVGCAEGYYAVGFARSMPDATIYAYDTSAGAVQLCQELASANGLASCRIAYGGEVTHAVLDKRCESGTLVLADIEGGEAALLDPEAAPRLARADMLVELHHNVVPEIEQLLRDRFAVTHVIRHVDSEPRRDPSAYPELAALSAADQLLAMFERPITMR
jgi:predicted O-methyltransferase YrrM